MARTRAYSSPTTEPQGRAPAVMLTEACWPVFEFITNFTRQIEHQTAPPGEQARYESLSALRDAEEIARDDPITERAWHDRVKAMMIYLIDYKMLNSSWDGASYWRDVQLEIEMPPDGLGHMDAVGGEKFFEDCNELQSEYDLAERRDRRDKEELGAQLNLYFICLRLGFKGRMHDFPQELGDYTHRLWARLPAQAATRGGEMFPQPPPEIVDVDYKLGMKLATVVAIFLMILITASITFRVAWNRAVGTITETRQVWENNDPKVTPRSAETDASETNAGDRDDKNA